MRGSSPPPGLCGTFFLEGLRSPQTPAAGQRPAPREKCLRIFPQILLIRLRKGVDAPGLRLSATPLASPIVANRDLLLPTPVRGIVPPQSGNLLAASKPPLRALLRARRDPRFAMGPATRIETLTDHFTVRYGQRHAGARQKTIWQNGCKRIGTDKYGDCVVGARVSMFVPIPETSVCRFQPRLLRNHPYSSVFIRRGRSFAVGRQRVRQRRL